jgi:class 3 adenylate cyclase/streptogramin lyase
MRGRRGRVLAAILFTDIVDSSAIGGEIGDVRWRGIVGRHHAIVRHELKKSGGIELDTAGDGFFAWFREPAAAIGCACAIADAVRSLGLEIRAGVHFGECEWIGRKLGGLNVVVAARLLSIAGPGDVLVTSTAREVVGGARFGFVDAGEHRLKGVAGEWRVYRTSEVGGETRRPPLSPGEAAAIRGRVEPPGAKRTRRWLSIGSVAVAAILVGAVTFELWRGTPASPIRVRPDSAVRIEPAIGAVDAVAVGSDPRAILVTDRFVWIARTSSRIVERVDARTRVVESVSASGHPTALAVDEAGRLWVLNGFDGTLDRIQPDQLRIELTVDLPDQTGDLVFGRGALWVTDTLGGSVIRVDPLSGATATHPIEGSEPLGVTFGGGSIWVTSGSALLRLRPSDVTLIDTITLRSSGSDVAATSDGVWVVHPGSDRLTRVDLTTGSTRSIAVGNQPQSVDAGRDDVWVAEYLGQSLSHVDGDGDRVERVDLAGRPFAVGVGGSGVWVTIV